MFRWKGENIATTEVADIIGMLDFIQDTNVYGVAVPGMNMFQVWKGFSECATFLSLCNNFINSAFHFSHIKINILVLAWQVMP